MVRHNAKASQTIARVFVEEALTLANAAGIDITQLLSSCALEETALDTLTADQFAVLWLAISEAMEDEYFGLGKRPMRPGSMTLMGHAVRGAPTFEIALRRALRFLRLVLEEPFGTLERAKDDCAIVLTETGAPRSAFAYRTYFMILHGLNCWLVGERIPLRSVEFPCAAPAKITDYKDYFGTPVIFGAASARLSFHARYLSRPVRRSEAELKAFLRTTPASLLRGYREEQSLKQRIVDEFMTGPPVEWPRAEEIAQHLGLSRATLHRALKERGQSLTGIKEELRRRQALGMLKETDMPIAQIAETLGYAELSAFYRAFRRWYGKPPGAYR